MKHFFLLNDDYLYSKVTTKKESDDRTDVNSTKMSFNSIRTEIDSLPLIKIKMER